MAKNYNIEKQIFNKNLPRRVVITRILAFSKSYKMNVGDKTCLGFLKN